MNFPAILFHCHTEPWTIGRANWYYTCGVKTGLGCAWRHSYTSKAKSTTFAMLVLSKLWSNFSQFQCGCSYCICFGQYCLLYLIYWFCIMCNREVCIEAIFGLQVDLQKFIVFSFCKYHGRQAPSVLMEGAVHTNTALLQMTLLYAPVCALYIQYIHYHITCSEKQNLSQSYSAFRMLWSL